MELSKIEKLLEKYLDATTTLQEETILKDYFLSNNVAPHLQEYESMFGYFNISKTETSAKSIQLTTKKKINWKRFSIAASIALLCSVYFGNGYFQEQKARKQYAQIKEGLLLLSSNLNKGNEAITTLYAYENTARKILKTK